MLQREDIGTGARDDHRGYEPRPGHAVSGDAAFATRTGSRAVIDCRRWAVVLQGVAATRRTRSGMLQVVVHGATGGGQQCCK
jgi:hypothetical protein